MSKFCQLKLPVVPELLVFPKRELDCEFVLVFPKRPPPPEFVFPNPELPKLDDPNPDLLLLPNMMASRYYTSFYKYNII